MAHHRCRSRSSSQSLHGDSVASLWLRNQSGKRMRMYAREGTRTSARWKQWRERAGASAPSCAERSRLSVTELTERTAAAARPGKKGGHAVESWCSSQHIAERADSQPVLVEEKERWLCRERLTTRRPFERCRCAALLERRWSCVQSTVDASPLRIWPAPAPVVHELMPRRQTQSWHRTSTDRSQRLQALPQ